MTEKLLAERDGRIRRTRRAHDALHDETAFVDFIEQEAMRTFRFIPENGKASSRTIFSIARSGGMTYLGVRWHGPSEGVTRSG